MAHTARWRRPPRPPLAVSGSLHFLRVHLKILPPLSTLTGNGRFSLFAWTAKAGITLGRETSPAPVVSSSAAYVDKQIAKNTPHGQHHADMAWTPACHLPRPHRFDELQCTRVTAAARRGSPSQLKWPHVD